MLVERTKKSILFTNITEHIFGFKIIIIMVLTFQELHEKRFLIFSSVLKTKKELVGKNFRVIDFSSPPKLRTSKNLL